MFDFTFVSPDALTKAKPVDAVKGQEGEREQEEVGKEKRKGSVRT